MSIYKNLEPQRKLEDYCDLRQQVVAKLLAAYATWDDAEALLKQAYQFGWGAQYQPPEGREAAVRHVDRSLWRLAMDKTGFRQLMDEQAINEFNRSLERDPPHFTIENVRSQFATMFQDADDMFRRGLVNVFRHLQNRQDYRTNSREPFKVDRKAVITYVVDGWSSRTRPRVRCEREAMIDDIDRVFCVMDGKPHSPRALCTAINQAWQACCDAGERYVFESEYYRVVGFLNGNTHWTFKRADLLDKANRLIAEHYGHGLAKDHPADRHYHERRAAA